MAAATIASQEFEIDMDKRRLCLLAGLKQADTYAVEILEIGTVVSIYELIAQKWVMINLLNRTFQSNIVSERHKKGCLLFHFKSNSLI